jgi:hypothetical protein
MFEIVMLCGNNGAAYQAEVLKKSGLTLKTLLKRLTYLEEWGFIKIDTAHRLEIDAGSRGKVIAVNAAMVRRTQWSKNTIYYYPFDIVLDKEKLLEVDMYANLVERAVKHDKLVNRSVMFAQSIIDEAKENGRITPAQIAALSRMGVNPKWKKGDEKPA